MQIQGITAFVTGGASGLGAATARLLAERGARVALYDLPRSKGADLEKELGGAARFLPGDVTDEAALAAALDQAIDAFGPLRALVNCAGIGSASRTVGKDGAPFPLDAFTRTIQINLIGTFNVHPAGGRAHGEERSPTRAASAARSSTPRRSRPSTGRSARPPTPRRRAASSA